MDTPPYPIVVDALRPWEQEDSFHDHLNHWMGRAPWIAVSVGAHLLAFFILMAVPWNAFRQEEPTVITADVAPDLEDDFVDDLEPEVEPELDPIEFTDDPVLVDAELTPDEPTDVLPSENPTPYNSPDSALAPFDAAAFNNEIGAGGGAGGGTYGGRFGRGGPRGGGRGTHICLDSGLRWLVDHQDEDGKWDCDGFMKHDPAGDACDGAGSATQDVGVSGLALLALLGDNHTTNEGQYRTAVVKGIRWLHAVQDPDTGLIGEASSHEFLYGHAIATLALCEAYYFSRSPLQRRPAQDAVNYIARARNPYGVWRYDVPATGDNDTSVTGWMVLALASAKSAGLTVDDAAFDAALGWFDDVTDPATGRTGYDSFGSLSSRTPANLEYPREKGEAMTAVALFCRFFLGQNPDEHEIMEKQADLLARTPPEWDPEGLGCDMYAWYYGSYAMFQMGGKHWKAWNAAMKKAILPSQRSDGAAKGSWDPVGPWGYSGGRVYSTALMVLCLEVYFRYGKVIGSR